MAPHRHKGMNSVNKSDAQLVKAIQSGGIQREKALRDLYARRGLRAKICSYIQNQGGNLQDGEDMYQEGIIVFDRNIREGKFREESSAESYLFSICKFLWKNQKRKNYRVDLKEDHNTMDLGTDDSPEIIVISKERVSKLEALIGRLGDRCRQVLKLWQLSFSMAEIADRAKLSSEGMARKTKYQCMKKLVEMIGDDETFKEWYNTDG